MSGMGPGPTHEPQRQAQDRHAPAPASSTLIQTGPAAETAAGGLGSRATGPARLAAPPPNSPLPGRGFGPVQIAHLQRRQRVHGNRSVARWALDGRPEVSDRAAAPSVTAPAVVELAPGIVPDASSPPQVAALPVEPMVAPVAESAAAGSVDRGVVQRGWLGNLIEDTPAGATSLISGAVAALKKLGPEVTSAFERLGPKGAALLQQMGEAVGEWGAKIAAVALNPVGALVNKLWLSIPDRFKEPLIDGLLGAAESIVDLVRGAVTAVLGPLWPVTREFILGFLRQMRQAPDKVELSNKLATVMSGGSATFALNFIKGLGLGIWDVIKMPYDMVVGMLDGLRLLARTLENMSREDLEEGLAVLNGGLAAAWDGAKEMVTDPQKALAFLETIWESLKKSASQMGRAVADQALALFRLPEDKMGEEAGRITTAIVIDVVLAIVTDGIAVALRRALMVIQEVSQVARKAMRAARATVKALKSVVKPIFEAIGKLAKLFAKSRFGSWLSRLGTWLDRFSMAVEVAMAAIALQERGEILAAQDEADEEEEKDPDFEFTDEPIEDLPLTEETEDAEDERDEEADEEADAVHVAGAPALVRTPVRRRAYLWRRPRLPRGRGRGKKGGKGGPNLGVPKRRLKRISPRLVEKAKALTDARAKALQALHPDPRKMTTIAAGLVHMPDGSLKMAISSSKGGYLPPAVRKKLRPDEIVVRGKLKKHAERNIFAWAKKQGGVCIAIGAGNNLCWACWISTHVNRVSTATKRGRRQKRRR